MSVASRLTSQYALILTILSACGSAYADRVPIQQAPPSGPAFSVDLVSESGGILPTYQHRGRFYVLGEVGERYSVRVTNPTGERVEAVISIDGLDAVDGHTADFVHKRGYVVPAYGSLVVDGFRVSMDDVATFRFSSVPSSYAGRKGQARHVGVVGVALFREQRQEPVYMPGPYQPGYDKDDDRDYDEEAAPTARKSASPPPTREPAPSPAPAEAAPPSGGHNRSTECYHCGGEGQGTNTPYRPGLGTEFGERRGSRVSYVPFVRANGSRPYAVVEVRYNDRDGLVALGIPLSRPSDPNDLWLRETANPFPHSGYAAPPPGWE
jgi:hypothetical protein